MENEKFKLFHPHTRDPVEITSLLSVDKEDRKQHKKKKDNLKLSGHKCLDIFFVHSGLNGDVNHLDLPVI